MGCCLTTQNPTKTQTQPESDQKHRSFTKSTHLLEEETVKEVLSLNPIKPTMENEPQDNNFEAVNGKGVENEPESLFIDEKVEFFKCKSSNEREIMQRKEQEEITIEQELSVSETYSFSLSESTCVSTTTLNNDDDYEVKQPPKRLPPRNRVRGVNKSPVRRSGQSPALRNNVGGRRGGSATSERSVYRREQGTSGRKMIRSDPNRSCQNPIRRSKSPATKRSEMGRGQSPGRVTKDPQESKLAMINSDNKTTATTGHVNETLENPLVSLECFIFL